MENTQVKVKKRGGIAPNLCDYNYEFKLPKRMCFLVISFLLNADKYDMNHHIQARELVEISIPTVQFLTHVRYDKQQLPLVHIWSSTESGIN